VTYSGLIAFVTGIVSLLSGLFFVLTVTRKLSTEEFGTWGLLGTIIGYFLVTEAVISFWNYRQIARGEEVGKSSIISSGIFAFGSIPIFLLVVYLIASQSNAILESLLLGTILLPIQYISFTLSRINLGHRPQVVSYGLLVFELVKIPIAILFVVIYELGLDGAIWALFISYLIRLIIQFYFAKPKLHNPFLWSNLKRWINLSWISLYTGSQKFFMTIDVLVYSIIVGSVIGIAFYTAALAIANIVTHSISISQGLDAKLLATQNQDHIKNNFNLVLFLGIPLLAISVIFSKFLLFALNPEYESAFWIVIILSFKVFFITLRKFAQRILISLDTTDVEKFPKFSNLLKSYLFRVPSLQYIFYSTYLISLIAILHVFQSKFSEVELVQTWSIIGLGFEFPLFIVMWVIVIRNLKISIPIKNILKYIAATMIVILVFYFSSEKIIAYEMSIYDYLPGLLIELLICGVVYLGITYVIDINTRKLLIKIIREFK
jgi:O-antigen/teichoic acid export membrane protein